MFGWIQAAHQLGGATAAWGAGYIRTATGNYAGSFVAAGFVCLAASMLVLLIGRSRIEPGRLQGVVSRG
jgi:sugar phosphate permease